MLKKIVACFAVFFALCAMLAAECGGPLTYCAPTPSTPLPIQIPPDVSAGAGTMFLLPWSNTIGMRLTDQATTRSTTSFGLFEAVQSNVAARSPMLGGRAVKNCNNYSPTCFYIRVIGSTAKVLWMDEGTDPTAGNWQVGQVCADNRNYSSTNGYEIGPAYDYGARTSNFWHTPKFLQTPGSEGILIDVELRTQAGLRNGGSAQGDAWLVARDITSCDSSHDVFETTIVDFNTLYPAFDPTHTLETQGYGPAFSEATATAISSGGIVSLTAGQYALTLNKTKTDSGGTAAVIYDAGLASGHWYDSTTNLAGGSWGSSGTITVVCAPPLKCKAQGTAIGAVSMSYGPNPVLEMSLTNKTFWDMESLNQTLESFGAQEALGIGVVVSDAPNKSYSFVSQSFNSLGTLTTLNPGAAKPATTLGYHVLFPAPLYTGSDTGAVFLSTSDSGQTGGCDHSAAGSCGIYGLANDGSGLEYAFFPHFSSGAAGIDPDAQKANLSVYVDPPTSDYPWSHTTIFWGSDWELTLGGSRTDIFAGLAQ